MHKSLYLLLNGLVVKYLNEAAVCAQNGLHLPMYRTLYHRNVCMRTERLRINLLLPGSPGERKVRNF